jgi:mycothiol system anti-sigma-R factor
MNCQRFREVVFLYTDNEMGEDLRIDFQQHLELCPRCARRIDRARRLLSLLRARCARASAPERLRVRILTSLPHRRL